MSKSSAYYVEPDKNGCSYTEREVHTNVKSNEHEMDMLQAIDGEYHIEEDGTLIKKSVETGFEVRIHFSKENNFEKCEFLDVLKHEYINSVKRGGMKQ